jgi:hypothetical protein
MTYSRSKLALLWFVSATILIFLHVPSANAIPVFARKYKTSCMTCHEMMPRLNAFGEAFRLNGFRWPGGTPPANEQEPVSLGAEANKKAFPNSVWPSDIPGSLPLALRTLGLFRRSTAGEREMEWEWELQTGGTIGEKVSFFGHANYVANSGTGPSTNNKLVLAGFTNFHDLFGTEHLVNLQLGVVAFEESDFFHYRNHATHSLLPASARTFGSVDTIPYPGGFNKPDVFKLKRGPGAMLWGFTPHSTYSLGYRIGDQDGGGSDMNVAFGQWAYKIGGMDYYGRTKQQFDQGYMENSLSFGVMGDVGSVGVRPTASAPLKSDRLRRVGADVRLKSGSWAGRAGAITGNNSNPYGTLAPGSVHYDTYFLQTEYHVLPWLLPEVRYEADRFRVPSALKLGQTNRARFVPSVSALYGANARFTLWGELYTKKRADAAGKQLDSSHLGLQFDMAF